MLLDVLSSSSVVLVFGADWCNPICRRHYTGFSGLTYKAFVLYLLCRVEMGAEEMDFGQWYWKEEETIGMLKLEFPIGNIWYRSGFSI